MTPSRMPTLGRKEKVMLEVTTLRSLAGSMPMAFPARYARTMKMMQVTATNRMIAPQIRYRTGLLSS